MTEIKINSVGGIMFLLFFILWIVFNGRITLEVCILGILISLLVFLFVCKFLGHSLSDEIKIYSKIPFIIKYIFTLIIEVVKANLSVIHLILTQEEEVEPVLAEFDHHLKRQDLSAFFSNAITLTPGTITVLNEDGKLTVHCLDESLASGFLDSETYKILKNKFDDEEVKADE